MGALRVAAGIALSFVWTFAPIYATEKLADYYFLTDNTPSFYFMSGWRLILFIGFALGGSIAAGALLRSPWKAAGALWSAVGADMALFFYGCDPRVCFSGGIDGLEPLRLGFFLGAVALSGAALGVALRGGRMGRRTEVLAGFFGFAAVGFYPVVFTFAGTRLLPPLHPWAAAAILFIVAFAISVSASAASGPRAGVLLPIASMGVLWLVSVGIAAAYLPQVALDAAILLLSVVAAAAFGGAVAAKRRSAVVRHRSRFSVLFALGMAFVIGMMIFATPDAVNGVIPSGSSSLAFAQGVPLYSGAAMTGPASHSEGAGVTVSFRGTNTSAIQADNYLSAGFGIHAAGCCVDGIDFSYRYDLDLFGSGRMTMLATAWEVCDDNAACGGHSWKSLMFIDAVDLGQVDLEKNFTLRVAWGEESGGAVVTWSYAMGGGKASDFASFAVPRAENHNFNTGILEGGTTSGQKASYFFQFGIMSRYSMGHGGWEVAMSCPAVLEGAWKCVDHAMTLTGSQSFWKIFWRWGEDFEGVNVASPRPGNVEFTYTGVSTPSFRALW